MPDLFAFAPEAGIIVPAADPDTTWTVILDPAAAIDDRVALNINTGPIRVSQDGIDWGQSVIDAYEAELGTWGSTVVDRRWPNRTVTINLLVGADDTGESGFYDAAQQLRQKVALWQRENGTIQRGSDVPMYAEVVNASLTFADQWGETGFLESNVVLTLECLPDYFGDEITLDAIPLTGYGEAVLQQDGEPAIIEGDHPSRCSIAITCPVSGDVGAMIIWGFRSRHYDPAGTAALIYEAEDLKPADGTVQTLAGASGGASDNVIEAGGLDDSDWTHVLDLQLADDTYLTHVGSYRVWARVYTESDSPRLQLNWGRPGDATEAINDIAVVGDTGKFLILDLGPVSISKTPIGDQLWVGSLYAQASTDVGATVDIDTIYLQPLDESAGYVQNRMGLIGGSASAPGTYLRTDGMLRWAATNSYVPIQAVFGDLPRLPPSGLEERPVEMFIKQITQIEGIDGVWTGHEETLDALSVVISYMPGYLFRP